MNRILTYLIYLTLALATVSALSSCEDRLVYPGYEDIPEGISMVDLKFSFPEYTPALESRSAGDAMRKIRTLWLAVYQDGGEADGKLIEKKQISNFTTNTTEDRPGASEQYTGHAEFRLELPNGRYRMYAVANHDLADADISTEDALFHLPLTWTDDAATGIDRNDQMFGWFRNDEAEPDYTGSPTSVTIKPGMTQLHSWVRRAASKLTVAFNTTNLNENVLIYLQSVSVIDIPRQCYLHSPNNLGEDDYRLAKEFAPRTKSSTIYFKGAEASHEAKKDHDKWPVIGSGDLVFGLYADDKGKHDVVIDEIPIYDENGNQVVSDEEYDRLYRAEVIKRVREMSEKEHNEYTRALYFYENMQAPGVPGTASDKRQIVGSMPDQPQVGDITSYPNGTYEGSHNEDGTLKDDAYNGLGWKDARPWGSYVEIKGYYENSTGKGPITYRFMLGKDATINYEAERNHHYKLTLVFNGDANDVDFHIDYEEEAKPGLFSPTETYVPYLYNQTSFTTVRATPRKGYELMSLKAVILDNEWRPYQGVRDVHYWGKAWDVQTGENGASKEVNGANYSYELTTEYQKDAPDAADNCEFGFLSLWRVKAVTFNAFGGSTNKNNKTAMVKLFREHYFKHETNSRYGVVSMGAREYNDIQQSNTSQSYDNDDIGTYTVSRSENHVNGEVDYVIKVPLFTRAKTLDIWAVYSGANPYYEHYRYARVRFIATYRKTDSSISGPDTYSDTSETIVKQARRIDNPRGIYRSENNLEPFHVNLKYLKLNASDAEAFEPVVSRGPWTATIESDPYGLVQISGNGQVARGAGSSITGRTDTEIDFVYKPLKSSGKNTYGAIITVTYHNNSCVHKILVKQGYIAAPIGDGKTKFSAFNVYSSTELVKNPLSIGSLFRCNGDLSMPIAESNNTRSGFGVGQNPTGSYNIVGSSNKTWANISSWKNWGNYDPFYTHTNGAQSFTLKNATEAVETGKYKVPTYEQTLELGLVKLNEEENEDNDINFAFGITYGDGAQETLTTSDAWSFSDPDNDGKPRKEGMRGIIIYSKKKGDNIFLPLGATGHGRRRSRKPTASPSSASYTQNGYMRYGDLDDPMTGNTNIFRPMAWNLKDQYGAVYWTSCGTASIASDLASKDALFNDEGYIVAFDMNYGNYMVTRGRSKQYNNSGVGWDALPLRLVKVD
ncbi:MAG: hypothetical protein HDS65_00365 [Bacteroidales bacterium]|nr:hypothetical protein [Bacteroidales bacterium]